MDDDDVAQGALGDCYFLSALSLVATEEGCCAGLIDDSLDAAGCYGVTLFHKGKWHMRKIPELIERHEHVLKQSPYDAVWVDGYFPCVVSNDPHSRALPKPLYAASSNRREIWPMVVEKAFAKLHGGAGASKCPHYGVGSWEAIGRGGHIGDALKALTGGEGRTVSTSTSLGILWPELLRQIEDPGVLVGAGTKPGLDPAVSRGVVDGHAYSLLHAMEVQGDPGGSLTRLVLLRNPWGHGEWTGDWSDKSEMWSKHPRIKAAAGNHISTEDDGRFWMNVVDFVKVFARVEMCKLPGSDHAHTGNHKLIASRLKTGLTVKNGLAKKNKNAPAAANEWLEGTHAGGGDEEGGGGRGGRGGGKKKNAGGRGKGKGKKGK